MTRRFAVQSSGCFGSSGYQVEVCESGRALLKNCSNDTPGCILLDMEMSMMNGLVLQKQLRKSGNTLPVIFLTARCNILASVQAIKAGAEDVLSMPVARKALIEAVERAVLRDSELRRRNDRINAMRTVVATLTRRESQVLKLMARGKLNKQTAYELGTSERTIKAHRHAIMQKLRIGSLPEAVVIAERLGLLNQGSDPEIERRPTSDAEMCH